VQKKEALNKPMYNLTQKSSTSLQYTRSRGRSWIQIKGVEMGRVRGVVRDQGVEMGMFICRWEELDPPGFRVLQ